MSDRHERAVDLLLTPKGDVAAARRFFLKAMTGTKFLGHHAGCVCGFASGGSGGLKQRERCRSECGSDPASISITESTSHRRVKQRIGPVLGFKRFDTAAVAISGIEVAAKSGRNTSRSKTARPADESTRNLGCRRGGVITKRLHPSNPRRPSQSSQSLHQ